MDWEWHEIIGTCAPLLDVLCIPFVAEWIQQGFIVPSIIAGVLLLIANLLYIVPTVQAIIWDDYDVIFWWLAPAFILIAAPIGYSRYQAGHTTFAITLWIMLAIVWVLHFFFLYVSDSLRTFWDISLGITALTIAGFIWNPVLYAKIGVFVGSAAGILLYLIFAGRVEAESKSKLRPINGGASAGASAEESAEDSSSFGFPSQIMRNGETYDLQETLGSVGRYKSRSTGEYRDFMDYELRPNTTTMGIDD